MKLNAKGLAMAGGIFWGLCLFVMTLIATNNGYGAEVLGMIANIYPGYEISVAGSVIGLIYGFIDGFVGLYIFAWLYNKFSK